MFNSTKANSNNGKYADKIFISPYCKYEEVKLSYQITKDPIIHDTTLREGEQSPGVILSSDDRVKIAEYLVETNIDCIEAGFPASSSADKLEVKRLVKLGLGPTLYGFARAVQKDIDAVIDCGCDGVVLSFPPSELHIKHKLRITKSEYLTEAVKHVEYAKDHGLDIIYSAEDSTRTELTWLKKVFSEVINAGVDVLRIVDTIGCITPTAMSYLIKDIKKTFDKPIEVHCHNDHGLGLANSLAAFEGGASRFSKSILGIGERSDIAPTEELIVAFHNFYGITKYNTEILSEFCSIVAKVAKIKIWPTKPIVGSNVFTHTSGIHQDAVLKNPIVYESFPAAMVGQERQFLLSKISGKAAVNAKLEDYGLKASSEELESLTKTIKEYSANRRSPISDEEFIHIAKQFFSEKIN